MSKKVIKAPAKINIVLRVIGKRADGYHNLLMLNEKLELADEILLTFEQIPNLKSQIPNKSQVPNYNDQNWQIKITCDDKSVPCDETNLCYKAAKLILDEACSGKACFARLAEQALRLQIHIKKRIPVAAGLGGGSSDAAAVLKGLNELLGLNWPREKLAGLGVKLGADVPFFLYDGPAICEGIGDKITPLDSLPNMWIILINPNFPVATKWVYEEFDKMQGLELTDEGRDVSHLRRNFKELGELVKVVHNDLEPVTAAKFPEIKAIEKLLTDNGALISWVSGSGPTVVGMFGSECARDAAAEKMQRLGSGWLVIRTSNSTVCGKR